MKSKLQETVEQSITNNYNQCTIEAGEI